MSHPSALLPYTCLARRLHRYSPTAIMILRGRQIIVLVTIFVLLLVRFHSETTPSHPPPDPPSDPPSDPPPNPPLHVFRPSNPSADHKSPTLPPQAQPEPLHQVPAKPDHGDDKFNWALVPQRHPVTSMRALPSHTPGQIPKIQTQFAAETSNDRRTRLLRLDAVKRNFTHAWKGYKDHAWLRDEVGPLSGQSFDPFGGWAATLVDALDTLWIMGLHEEFKAAVNVIDTIDFSTCALTEINVFETTIRYLGGFLSAYDLSGGKYPVLLRKAEEMGDMLYMAFDTPNRMPITRWKFKEAAAGASQEAAENMLIAEIGSLTLEFTRLSQITGDPRYYDAVQRIMDHLDAQQDDTYLPGMWPVVVNARTAEFTGATGFTIGGMADSVYEYLPKVLFNGIQFSDLTNDW